MSSRRAARPVVIKKYGNRRLYDTRDSRYITLEELAGIIRAGDEVRVVEAKSGEDLTQATLVQIIMDGRGAAELLPVALLTQLVRMGDDALAEFLGRYMTYALELYQRMKQGAQAMAPYNPFAALPFTTANDLARFFAGAPSWLGAGVATEQPPAAEAPEGDGAVHTREAELAELRREVEALKEGMKARVGRPEAKKAARRRGGPRGRR